MAKHQETLLSECCSDFIQDTECGNCGDDVEGLKTQSEYGYAMHSRSLPVRSLKGIAGLMSATRVAGGVLILMNFYSLALSSA